MMLREDHAAMRALWLKWPKSLPWWQIASLIDMRSMYERLEESSNSDLPMPDMLWNDAIIWTILPKDSPAIANIDVELFVDAHRTSNDVILKKLLEYGSFCAKIIRIWLFCAKTIKCGSFCAKIIRIWLFCAKTIKCGSGRNKHLIP